MFELIKRIFRSGWYSFSRDGELAIATVFILFLAVTLVSSLLIFRDISQFLIVSIQEKVDVSVYFKKETSEEEIFDIKGEISEFPEIKNIKYVSQEQALEDFMKRHEREPLLIESIEELGRNPFLASLNITTWDPSQYGKVSRFFEGIEFENIIEKIDYYQRKSIIERIHSINSIIAKFGISFSIILVIVAIAVTFNTIRLSIYNSRKEIKVQRLVGASNWFIRGPFLIQGLICGVLATLISLLVFSITCWFLSPKVLSFFNLDLFGLFTQRFWLLLFIQFATGIGLGVISSMVAVKKYLKV
ncbi:MAG: FtsX-like permease family protein [Candidatus Nealsonbacteria bacterium]|nr:MAG: FtsX-like permease family protein [Candidatus Nealsonbacteria bacterium]